MSDNPQNTPKLPPDQYHELVQKVADRVWKLMQAEQRVRTERQPAEGRRRRRS